MNSSYEDSEPSPATTQSTVQAEDWSEHEHVSEQIQREAQKLVDQAGSPGIAKMAIEVIELQQGMPRSEGSDA